LKEYEDELERNIIEEPNWDEVNKAMEKSDGEYSDSDNSALEGDLLHSDRNSMHGFNSEDNEYELEGKASSDLDLDEFGLSDQKSDEESDQVAYKEPEHKSEDEYGSDAEEYPDELLETPKEEDPYKRLIIPAKHEEKFNVPGGEKYRKRILKKIRKLKKEGYHVEGDDYRTSIWDLIKKPNPE